MKRLVAISLAGAMLAAAGLAQSSNPWVEQWLKSKTGRYSPMEEGRLKAERERAEQLNAVVREDMPRATPRTASATRTNSWVEQWLKSKTGRYSPMEEARLKAERANMSKQEHADSGSLLGSL